ncbi:MAG: M12 family metallo-peptidase, partial [Cellulophaga sp.]|nr:M12 family metallo-peptidase [Cellulophaga sp.]
MTTNLRLLFAIPIFFIGFCGFSQVDYWQESNIKNSEVSTTIKKLSVQNAKVFRLEEAQFKAQLSNKAATSKKEKLVFFPDESGKMTEFSVQENTIFSPELAAKYPEIKSYKGVSLEDPNKSIRFSVSQNGIQSMLVDKNSDQTTFMQKTANGSAYILYARNGLDAVDKAFVCETQETFLKSSSTSRTRIVTSQVLKKFRVAISATGEYTQYHGGTVPDALAAINATLTRINMVFETDLGITLELVANTDLVIYTSAITDPYNGNLNSQAQNNFNNVIGAANYDIGHLFNRANNAGDAGFIGSVCIDAQKGSAFSSALVPEGDFYDVDFVAHEMGHQLGANHTWSFESEGSLVQVEPGSGTTIMGYAGITGVNNVAPNGQDYFHYISIKQISDNLATTTCAVEIPLLNTPPVIAPLTNYVIPKSTAFVLSGNATDSDLGDVLTYAWEQIDDGIVTNLTFGPNNPSGANFRSQQPTTNPERYFPMLSRVLQGNLTQSNPTINSAWETVSDVEREMNFALTVRDNSTGGGQVAAATLKVDVVNNSGTFSVLSQNAAVTYDAGSVQSVIWDVANTNQTPINTAEVDIFLSTDGGLTFPILVAQNVKNDGEHEILIPNTVTSQARLMIKASDNIYFAVNTTNFTIATSPIILNFNELQFEVCQPNNLVIPFVYETDGVFSEATSFSVTGLPVGVTASFSPATVTANNTNVTLTLGNITAAVAAEYSLEVTATAASASKQVPIQLNIFNDQFSPVVLNSPADGATDTSTDQVFEWTEEPISTNYDIEIATDLAFTNVIVAETVIFNSYKASSLIPETTYYWRVKPKNNCGEGVFSMPFSFVTPTIDCKQKFANNLPQTISASGTPTITSVISFIEDLPVADINVVLNITHTFLADLKITLISPQGTKVVLVSSSCGENNNINATFDASAPSFVCGTLPSISGTVRPLGSLASFNGESSQGDWILEINDNAGGDGGALNSFGISLCVEGQFRPDEDNDGVFDDGDDLCLGTALGQEVNADGCPVFRFDPANFAVSLSSETCRDNNDGALEIRTITGLNYSVTTSGNGINILDSFTTNYVLNDLAAGDYTVCITGTDGIITYEVYCFDFVITQP